MSKEKREETDSIDRLLKKTDSKWTTDSVDQLDGEAFMRLFKLKGIPFKNSLTDMRHSQHIKVLETALEYSSLTKDTNEQLEYIRAVVGFDPILWDLLIKRLPKHFPSYPTLLRMSLLILQENGNEIQAEYGSIVRPYRWGGKLKPQHLKYEKFVKDHFSRDLFIMTRDLLIMASFPVLLIVFTIYAMLSLN